MKKIHLTIGMIIIIVSSFAQSDLGNNDYSRFEIGLNQTPTLFKYNNRQEKLDFSQIIGIRSDYSITKKMSILVPLDSSKDSVGGLDKAISIAKQSDGKITGAEVQQIINLGKEMINRPENLEAGGKR